MTKVRCPICQKLVTQRRIEQHIASKHPDTFPSSVGASRGAPSSLQHAVTRWADQTEGDLYLIPHADLIEAARLAAETLCEVMQAAEIRNKVGPLAPFAFTHYTDSVGTVVSERA